MQILGEMRAETLKYQPTNENIFLEMSVLNIGKTDLLKTSILGIERDS
jgi:hypothetical protein